jgi:hypothetical protein
MIEGIEKNATGWNAIDSSWHGVEDVRSLPLSPRDATISASRVRFSYNNHYGSRPVSRQLSQDYIASNPGSRVDSPHNLMTYIGPDIGVKISSPKHLLDSSNGKQKKQKSTPKKRVIVRSIVKEF